MRSRHHSTSSSATLGDGSTPGVGLDRRHHDLAPLVVGDADDADVADRGMADQHRLDLGRIDVHAAADDEVRAAVGEEEVAVVVDVADVAEREVVAAVGAVGLLGRLVVLEAAGRRRLQVDGADRARRDLGAVVVEDADVVGRVDLADGARLRQPLRRAAPSVPDAFGRRVVLPHDRPEPLDEPLLHVDRARRRAVEDEDQRRDVVAAPSRRRAATAAGGTSSAPCACA